MDILSNEIYNGKEYPIYQPLFKGENYAKEV